MFKIFILKHFRKSFWVHWHFVKQKPTGCFGKPTNWEGEAVGSVYCWELMDVQSRAQMKLRTEAVCFVTKVFFVPTPGHIKWVKYTEFDLEIIFQFNACITHMFKDLEEFLNHN